MKEILLKILSGGYVDDVIRSGDSEFPKLVRNTNNSFTIGESETLPTASSGLFLSRKSQFRKKF